jgi:hypothetical protein
MLVLVLDAAITWAILILILVVMARNMPLREAYMAQTDSLAYAMLSIA